jgi:hypothetical protein
MKAERDRTVSAHEVRHKVSQRKLREIEALRRKQRVTLVDQVEDGTDNDRYPYRSLRHTFGEGIRTGELPIHDSQRLRRL